VNSGFKENCVENMRKIVGTLLPLTALDSQKGDKDLFEAGAGFVDWLAETGQNAWQLLPLHQTSWLNCNLFDSPYSSYGVGLNPMYLSKVKSEKEKLKSEVLTAHLFRMENRDWVEDYGLWLALCEEFKTDEWMMWPDGIRSRDEQDLKIWVQKLDRRIEFFVNQQADLHLRYWRLKKKANDQGIAMIGDLPFYLPLNSPLVWVNQQKFRIFGQGRLKYFSGAVAGKLFVRQAWGHPIYNWNEFEAGSKSIEVTGERKEELLSLWKLRLKYASGIYDWLRLDSGIRFYVYAILDADDASNDRIVKGPGDIIFQPLAAYARSLGLNLLVEDISDFEMRLLWLAMDKVNVPGLSVLSLCLAHSDERISRSHFSTELYDSDHFYYTSNHDAQTLMGFVSSLNVVQRTTLAKEFGFSIDWEPMKIARYMRNFLLQRTRRLILPLQDWLLSKERINIPGTVGAHNWTFQAPEIEHLAINR
jgi:4-alpha-glucanotransferase